MVRVTGLEPAHRLTPEPKSGASANSATPAYLLTFISCDSVVCLRKFTNLRISSISQIIDLECHLNSATPAYLLTFISCDSVVCLRKFTNFRISSISQITDLECHLNSATPAYLVLTLNFYTARGAEVEHIA